MPHNDLHDLDTDQYQTYAAFMHKFELQGNGLEALPENFFTIFENLNELNISENKLKELPGGFSSLKALEILDISSNELKALPKDFSSVIDTLEILNISSNPFSNIPDEIFSLINLRILKANNIGHITLKGIGKLKNLIELYIASNYIDDIPDELGKLCLSHLDLSGIPWFPKFLEQEIQPNFSTFRTALKEVMIFRLMTEEVYTLRVFLFLGYQFLWCLWVWITTKFGFQWKENFPFIYLLELAKPRFFSVFQVLLGYLYGSLFTRLLKCVYTGLFSVVFIPLRDM